MVIIKNNAIPGIKVDKGAKPLAGSSEETVTEGLDGLRERLKEYYKLGARFTKWRAVIKITNTITLVISVVRALILINGSFNDTSKK